jgi:AraC-like DNA-binding protein
MTSTALPTQAVPTLRFSSNHFATHERLPAFQEHIGHKIIRLEVQPLSDCPLDYDFSLHALPGLPVFSGRGSGSHMVRTKELIADDDFSFAINSAGPWHASQLGREAVVGTGDAILASNGNTACATLAAWRGIMFGVPATAIAPLVRDPYALVLRPIPAQSPVLQLLTSYLGIVLNGPPATAPELQHLAVTHVLDLVAVALGATRDAAEIARGRGVRAARLQAVVAEIRKNFADPAFSPAAVAAKLRMTPRYVHDLLQETGLCFSDHVIELRLEKARALLQTAAHRHRKIIDIAYSCGFNDLSYFNRRFRRRFGASPAQYRGVNLH